MSKSQTIEETIAEHADDCGMKVEDVMVIDLGRTWSREQEYRELSMELKAECGEEVGPYFDHEAFGRDLVLGGDFTIDRYADGYVAMGCH